MTMDEIKKHSPPYVSYKTFTSLMSRLQEQLPSRIDRSYWGDMFSGSAGTQLMSAMRFLNLIDANGRPTPRLKLLTTPSTPEYRTGLWKQVAEEVYVFVLKGPLDIQHATYAEVEEVFQATFKMKKDVCRKCIKFFSEFSKEAGLPVSPLLTKKGKVPRTSSGTKNTKPVIGTRTKENIVIPNKETKIPEIHPWHQMMMEKFPSFDPNWPDDIKAKWFEGFDKLFNIYPH